MKYFLSLLLFAFFANSMKLEDENYPNKEKEEIKEKIKAYYDLRDDPNKIFDIKYEYLLKTIEKLGPKGFHDVVKEMTKDYTQEDINCLDGIKDFLSKKLEYSQICLKNDFEKENLVKKDEVIWGFGGIGFSTAALAFGIWHYKDAPSIKALMNDFNAQVFIFSSICTCIYSSKYLYKNFKRYMGYEDYEERLKDFIDESFKTDKDICKLNSLVENLKD